MKRMTEFPDSSRRLVDWLRAGMILLMAGGFLLLVLLVGFVLERMDVLPDRVARKRFRQPIAEAVRVPHGEVRGVDLIRCGACRVEKMRTGPFTLGGMNRLVLENLRVVLPGKAAESRPHAEGADGGDARDLLGGLGVGETFLRAQGLPKKFSGLRVNGLEVARLDGTNVVELFSAVRGEATQEGLALERCRVVSGGVTTRVHRAVLKIRPRLVLAWRGGETKLLND